MNKWKTKFRELIIFVLGIIFATCSIVLAETCQTTLSSSNVTYDNTTVQAETNELITQAGNIDSRVTTLEGYFKNNPVSEFNGRYINVKSDSEHGVLLQSASGTTLSQYVYSGNATYLIGSSSTGTWGQGPLGLYGKPITISANQGGTGDINLNGNVKVNGNDIGIKKYSKGSDGITNTNTSQTLNTITFTTTAPSILVVQATMNYNNARPVKNVVAVNGTNIAGGYSDTGSDYFNAQHVSGAKYVGPNTSVSITQTGNWGNNVTGCYAVLEAFLIQLPLLN